MDPVSPSRLVPGAWPASPSPPRHRCNSAGGPRLRQHIPSLSSHKITSLRLSHSYFNSKPVLATSTADNTPTSFTSDLSLQSSSANTSISSAYMSPCPWKSEDKSLQYQGKIGRHQSSSPERGIDTYCESPSLPGDQTYLSLPEIPDLSSLSSLQEDFHITQDNFNVSDNEPSCLNFDENILEMQASSLECRSFDTFSSSIRFRPTEVPPLEWDTQALQLPQPNDRNSCSLFLSPISASLWERSHLPLQPARTPLGIRIPKSEYQSAVSACTNVRRSWMVGNNLSGPTNGLPEGEASTRRYATEVLDHAFHMDADGSMFTLSIPGVDISPDIPPLKVVSNPQRRVKFSRIAKRLVHRVFNKPRIEGTIPENPTSQAPETIRHSRHCRYSLEVEEPKLQVRGSVSPRGGASGPSSKACTLQNTQDAPELRVREFKLSGIKIRKRSTVSSTPAYPSERPRPHKTTSENQHFLSCDISKLEKPKENHRRSFLRRIGI